MSDSKRKTPSKDTADTKRRGAVRYLALGLGLAAGGFLVPRRAHAAYGKCTVSGCYCCGFTNPGQGNLCSNCGHQYSDHGGATC
ncbi:MAG TPA: hypothetical protein VL979_14690 [Solirubrobacteraceae bacterium]|nr:hypothetical protein [Solirubrobacteraceae bacterium]